MTQGEKDSIKMSILKVLASPEGQLYKKQLERFKIAVCEGMFAEKGEDLAKSAGVIRGLNMALNLDKYI